MTRTQFATASLMLLGVALGAVAQPPQGPPFRLFGGGFQPPQPKGQVGGFGRPNVVLKGTGKPVEQTAQQAAGWWADKLIADLEQLRVELIGVRVPPAIRKQLEDRADLAIEKANLVSKALAQNNRRIWYKANEDLEAATADLKKGIVQHLGNNPAILLSLARVEYAVQQLGASLTQGDDANAAQVRRAIVNMSAALEQQAERLLAEVNVLPNAGPNMERDARQFARAAGRFSNTIANNGNLDTAKKELLTVGKEWNDLEASLEGFPNLPHQVHFQTHRVDGTYRRLATLLDVVPPAPPQPPMPLPKQRISVLAVGADAGMEPRVVVYGDDKGTVVNSFFAYNRQLHRSGIRVAVADLNGDGQPEIITINGGQGHARLKVFDGRDANPLLTFDGFDQKVTPYGYFVAAADLTKDGRALVAIAPDAGGPPAVEVYDLAQGKLLGTVQPFHRDFAGGIRLAWGDVNGDGTPDLICASGPGDIASKVKVFDGSNLTRLLGEFLGVDDKYKGGLFVAAADFTKNNRAEIIVGLDEGYRPLIRVFDGTKNRFIAEYEPFPNNFRGGVRVAVGDPDDGARLKIICAPGPGGKDLPIKVLRLDGKLHAEMDPFPRLNKGMYIGSR